MPTELTDDQMALYIETFYILDADCDDLLTRDELFQLLEQVKLAITPEKLTKLLKDLKIDGNRIGKLELLRIAKIILDEMAPKPEKQQTKFTFSGFTANDVGKSMAAWFEGEQSGNTGASFFAGATAPMAPAPVRSTAKVSDSSAVATNDYVVNIVSDDESESDYEYYTSESDNDSLAANTAANARRQSISSGSTAFEAKNKPRRDSVSGGRPRGDSISTDSARPSARPSIAEGTLEIGAVKRTVKMSEVDDDKFETGDGDNLKPIAKRPSVAPVSGEGVKRKQSKHVSRGKKSSTPMPAQSQGKATVAPTLTAPKPKNAKQAALADPKVRRQLANVKEYAPRFLTLLTLVQTLMMMYEIYANGGFEPITTNPLAGPSALTLTQLGAMYPPCMKPDPTFPYDRYERCHSEIDFKYKADNGSCLHSDNLHFICGMGGFSDPFVPDQVFRFIMPVILHSGVVHFLLTMLIQLRIGFRLERQIGSLRMAVIYLLSAFAGFVFAGSMSFRNVTTGASGAGYGLFALLYLDLIRSWPILRSPWKNFQYLTMAVIFALAIGLLPFIDNYAHIGGFVIGGMSGVVFMPSVYFSTWDKRRKRIEKLVMLPLVILILSMGLYSFYTEGTSFCPFCQYLNCIPPNSGWCQTELG